MSRTLRIPRASNVVVDAMRDWILSERLPSGYKLPNETELMEKYGLGRTTVREAVRLLESDGLVEVRRGAAGGTFVRHVDIRELSGALTLLFSFRETRLAEFVDFRRVIEPEIAALAAQNATDEQRASIVKEGSGESHAADDTSPGLHALLAAACGNGVLEIVMEAMSESVERHLRPEQLLQQCAAPDGASHGKIAQRVAAGDAAGARRAMARHVEAYAQSVAESGLSDAPIVSRRIGRT